MGEDINNRGRKQIVYERVDWIHVALDQSRALVDEVTNISIPYNADYTLLSRQTIKFSRNIM